MIYDLKRCYVIRFYNEAADGWRYFVRHQVDPYRYNISSTQDLSEAKIFECGEQAEWTATQMVEEMRTEVRVYPYDEKELFKLVLSGK